MRLTVTRTLSALVVIITLALLGFFIFGVDPETLTRVGEWSFFGLWFFFLQSSVFLILVSLSKRFLGEERTNLYQGAAWRQGALVALFLTGVMTAQYFGILTWWGALFLLAFLLLLELTYRRFQSFKR